MAYQRSRNAVLMAKIESSEGTDASPSASTDSILIANPQITPSINLIETNEVTGSLDGFGDIVAGMKLDVSFDVYLKGSGAAGTAPEFGPLLKACGMTELVTASAVPASPEACAAGGSTTSAVLGASASTSLQAYRGMPVSLSGVVTADTHITNYTTGKIATLTDTMLASVVATSNYQIPANVVYSPASSSIPSLTMYFYKDGLLYKIVGARGTFSLTIDSGGVGKLSFRFMGMYLSKEDAAVPAAIYDSVRPPVFKNAVLKMNRQKVAAQQLTVDFGGTLTNPDNPNALEGFDPAQITNRKITGSINPAETLVATRDIMTAMRNGDKQIIHSAWGSTAGNKAALIMPQCLYTGETPGDREGLATVDVPFQPVGQDSGIFLTFY